MEINEHIAIACLGLLTILVVVWLGHSDASTAISIICVGGSSASSAKSIFSKE